MKTTRHGEPLDSVSAAALRQAVERLGEQKVWSRLGLCPTTGARALAGLRLTRGSRALIAAGLPKVVSEAA